MIFVANFHHSDLNVCNKLQEKKKITFHMYQDIIMSEHMCQSLFHRSGAEVKYISDIKNTCPMLIKLGNIGKVFCMNGFPGRPEKA